MEPHGKPGPGPGQEPVHRHVKRLAGVLAKRLGYRSRAQYERIALARQVMRDARRLDALSPELEAMLRGGGKAKGPRR